MSCLSLLCVSFEFAVSRLSFRYICLYDIFAMRGNITSSLFIHANTS